MAHIYNKALVKPTNFCSNASLMNDILDLGRKQNLYYDKLSIQYKVVEKAGSNGSSWVNSAHKRGHKKMHNVNWILS